MSPSEHQYELALDLPAAHRGVRVARNVVRHFARMEGVKDEEIERMVLIVSASKLFCAGSRYLKRCRRCLSVILSLIG